MNKASVLQISPFFSPNIGGVETHLDDLINLLNKSDIRNTVVTYQPLVGQQKGKSYEIRGDNKIYRIPWISDIFYKTCKYPLIHFLYLTPWLGIRSLFLMNRIRKEIDIIHAHGFNAAVVGLFVKKVFHKPLVTSLHVEFNLHETALSTRFILFAIKKADYILVLTKRSKDKLMKMGIDGNKIKLYSYWVDQQVFKPQSKQVVKKELKWDKRFSVLFVGRLTIEKGVEILLDAAKKLPDIRVVIAGTGQLDEKVKKTSKEYKNIIYLGKVSNDKLTTYYNAADVLVVPSLVKKPRLEYEEGMPRVIIESLSCGLPVIGTDNGGVKEIISVGKIGEICGSSVSSLISIIRKLSTSGKMDQYRKKARQYAVEHFNENKGLKIIEAYENLRRQALMRSKLTNILEKVGDMALKRRAQSIVEALDLREGQKILDAGCGDGFYLHLLSNLGMNLQLTGIDLDTRGLESARRNLGKKEITLIQADLMGKLPFPINSFDHIIMSEVAEHLPDDTKGLREAYRVLKPGGKFLLTVPCQNYPFLWDPLNWVLERLVKTHIRSGFWAGIWNQHKRLYSLKGINLVLNSAGFNIEESEIQTFWCIPFNHHVLNLGARLMVGDHLPDSVKDSASKFSKSTKSVSLVRLFFKVVNLVDKLNKLLPGKSSGVSIFVKAKK